MVLNDLKTKMNRRKIETLVPIHVHQRRCSRIWLGCIVSGRVAWMQGILNG